MLTTARFLCAVGISHYVAIMPIFVALKYAYCKHKGLLACFGEHID